jgi:geranylgeranyl diphosphate synthase type II
MRDIRQYLEGMRKLVDEALERWLPAGGERPTLIHEAMHYSVFAGGKRLRPILVLAAAEAVGVRPHDVLPAAAALEMIHTYSLIHDDLPAMDDDDFRRGRPTCHKVYGEAMAILAGDALLTHAFRVLADPEAMAAAPAERRVRVICEVAEAAGSRGMVGGQVVDILSEDQAIDLATLQYLHRHKTGALFRASVRVGGILAGAEGTALEALSAYADRIGLAFQIVDDILDIEGITEELGKTAGSDLRKKKATFPALLGIEESRQEAMRLIAEAQQALRPFGELGWALGALAEFIGARRN